jgi:aspartyl-tRNA(Asn)/glutamyl-tRNA(Gln) amidotransferase subunit C
MIDLEEVKHIAQLARIEFSEEELKDLEKDLSSILDYFHRLEEVNVDDVKLVSRLSKGGKTMREDKPSKNNSQMSEKLLGLAPRTKSRFVKVKSVFN